MDRIMHKSGPLRHNASAIQISFSKVILVVYGESAVDPPLDVPSRQPTDRVARLPSLKGAGRSPLFTRRQIVVLERPVTPTTSGILIILALNNRSRNQKGFNDDLLLPDALS